MATPPAIERFPRSLGIRRIAMPQIRSFHQPAFFAYLEGKGHEVRCTPRRVGDLKPTQAELNLDRARRLLADQTRAELKKRIIISRDDFILDGHHRWAALRIEDPRHTIEACKVNLRIRPLLRQARRWNETQFATIEGVSRTGLAGYLFAILVLGGLAIAVVAQRSRP
jgi:hypothetical protein